MKKDTELMEDNNGGINLEKKPALERFKDYNNTIWMFPSSLPKQKLKINHKSIIEKLKQVLKNKKLIIKNYKDNNNSN